MNNQARTLLEQIQLDVAAFAALPEEERERLQRQSEIDQATVGLVFEAPANRSKVDE